MTCDPAEEDVGRLHFRRRGLEEELDEMVDRPVVQWCWCLEGCDGDWVMRPLCLL